MKRRDLFLFGGRAALYGLAASAIRRDVLLAQRESHVSPDPLEQRIAGVIQAYDAQGNHRTGTDVDNASAEWLARQVRQSGAEASLEPFPLSRIDPQSCYLRIGGRRIDSVPMFDAGFTGGEGVHGKLGPLGSDAEIGLAESEPAKLRESGIEQRDQVWKARRSQHKAVVVLTRGVRPGLFLLNASDFRKPFGPPMLQISSSEKEWLRELAAARAEAKLVAQVERTATQALNVTAKIAGSNPALRPIVLMAPRSAWWQCVSEQGSRLACWLEAIRVIAAGKPARDCFFVALSGHELGLLGMDPYIQRRPDLIRRAHAWIFFGSDIGAPQQPNHRSFRCRVGCPGLRRGHNLSASLAARVLPAGRWQSSFNFFGLMKRYLLILLAVLLAGSIGAFFLFVAILPALGVAAVLIGLFAMFRLSFHVGQNPATVAGQLLTSGWLLGQINAIMADDNESAAVPERGVDAVGFSHKLSVHK